MDDLIVKSKALNALVPILINKTEYLKKEIKTRMKLNNIFSEFENKASNKLSYFIENSNKRYNYTKYGNDLDLFIQTNQTRNESEANKILTDNFYKDENIEKERQKMKYKSTSKIYKDIKDTFKQIKIPSKLKPMNGSKKTIKILINKIKNNLTKEKIDLIKTKVINKNLKKEVKKENKDIIYSKDIKEKEKLLKFYINMQEKLIKNSINQYLNDVNNKSNFFEGSGGYPPWQILNSTPFKKKPNINLPNIKFFNYIKSKPIKRNLTEKEMIRRKPDIKKVLPYSKYGKNSNSFIYNRNNNLSLKDIENNNCPFLTEANICINRKNDFRNTVNIVYNSANKELQMKNNLDKKRRKIDELIGFNKIPLLSTYDDIIFKKSEQIKFERYKNSKRLNKSQKYEYLPYKDRINILINKKIKILDKIEQNPYKKININYIKKLKNLYL